MNPFLAVVARKKAVIGGGGGGGGAFYRSLTVDHALVPGTQTDFPVLVSLTHATLKTVANGGHVNRSDGFDIGFYSNSGLTTKLKWEMESYSPTAGTVVAWVKIPSLSAVSDTIFYMGYGDSAITTDQSDPANVWTNGFLGVYHLGNGTTLNVNSSTGSNNGTNTNSVTATTGQIDGCGSFASASTQYVDLGTGMNPSTAATYSIWVKATSFPSAYNSTIVRNGAIGSGYFGVWVKADGTLGPGCVTSGAGGAQSYNGGTHTLSIGTWYYVSITYSAANGLKGYVDGAIDGSNAPNGDSGLTTTAKSTRIGNDAVNTFNWNGQLDEVRVASVERSANWITTEYNNQNSPSTFTTVGTEV